ncbi:glycosyltransferase [Cellulomonas sp. Marseille-Q8402]
MTRRHAVCTIVARNYIAQARVLARSFVAHNPDAHFVTLIIDGDDSDRSLDGLGAVVLPADLGLDQDVLDSMHVMYDVMEYATALKPAMLMHLHRSGAASASYFDPDIRVYGRLDDVFESAVSHGVALTPHALAPLPRDGKRLTESDIMHSGMYNLGFIATGGSAYRFLTWWHERLTTDAVVDLGNALFTDQRWIDWAPSFEAVEILRDPGLNAAYWNLHEREIRRGEDGEWRAGDRPLRFFHFSGYDPAKPWLLSKHLGPMPRTLLSEHSDLRALCDDYGRELVELEHVTLRKNPYRNDRTPDGLRLTPLVRRMYRDSVVSEDRTAVPAPNPLRDPAAFRAWLTGPTVRAGQFSFSRFEYAIWRMRDDLQRAFPAPLGPDAQHFRNWLDADPGAQELLASLGPAPREEARTSGAPRPRASGEPDFGWSLVGYARAELGVGEAGRRLSQAVSRTGVPWEMVGVTQGPQSRQQHRYQGRITEHPRYVNSILCVNADQTPLLAERLDLGRNGGIRVGYWFWELEDFPALFDPAFEYVDEVWVSTTFNQRAVAARTGKPVRVVPLPITAPRDPTLLRRHHLGLPEDKTVFLANFDFLSVMARKNPLGAIEAYRAAFGPDDGAVLVVKSINGHLRPTERERLRLATLDRPDIVLRDGYLTAHEMRALTELVDCVVSVHRSEGFGLNLADAMAVGTPVVATAYSGNMDFMTEDTAFLVPYNLTDVGPDADPYDAKARWADPDLALAAAAMRSVHDDPARAKAVASRARTHIAQFSVDGVASTVAPLLTRLPAYVPHEVGA